MAATQLPAVNWDMEITKRLSPTELVRELRKADAMIKELTDTVDRLMKDSAERRKTFGKLAANYRSAQKLARADIHQIHARLKALEDKG